MPFRIGQRVRLSSTGEVGLVVWLWHNSEIDTTDAYVAFFGAEWPVGEPSEKPYVLRYLASSLEALEA
jgi:hypothetical protein